MIANRKLLESCRAHGQVIDAFVLRLIAECSNANEVCALYESKALDLDEDVLDNLTIPFNGEIIPLDGADQRTIQTAIEAYRRGVMVTAETNTLLRILLIAELRRISNRATKPRPARM